MRADIKLRTEDKVQEVLEYLDNSPINLDAIIQHDEVWETCYKWVINELTAEAEAREDERKESLLLGEYNGTN